MEQQCQQAISPKNTAIYLTNAQRRDRRQIIFLAPHLGFTHITEIQVNTPVWLCLAGNQRRERQVAEKIILRMHRHPPKLGTRTRQADAFSRNLRVRKLRSPSEQEPHLIFYILC